MATIPTVINLDEERIPQEGSPTFREDAFYVWSSLPTVVNSFNSSILITNSEIASVNALVIEVNNSKNAAINAQIASEAAASESESSATRSETALAEFEATAKTTTPASGIAYNTEATDKKNYLQNQANFSGFGNTKRVSNTDRFQETDTANTIVDVIGDEVRFSDGLIGTLGDEEAINGDFRDGLIGWGDASGDFAVINEQIVLEAGSLIKNLNIQTEEGKTYTVLFSLVYRENSTTSNFGVTARTSGDSFIAGETGSLENGIHPFQFKATTSTSTIRLYSPGGKGIFDSISVRKLSQVVFSPSPFGAGSTDELIATGSALTSTAHTKGDITITEDGDNIYQATVDTAIGSDVTGGDWQSMTEVTRYDVIGYAPTGYKTFKGTNLFTTDMSTDDIATGTGFSKLGDGLYSVGGVTCVNSEGNTEVYTGEITSLRVVQRLNGAMCNLAHNSLGSLQNSAGEFWYNETTKNTSTYDVFNTAVNTTSGRADGKVCTKIYNEKTGGIVGVGSYCINDIDLDVEASKLLNKSGLDCGVELISRLPVSSNAVSYAFQHDINDSYSVGDIVIIYNTKDNTRLRVTISRQGDDYVLWDDQSEGSYDRDVNYEVYATKKVNSLLTQGGASSTDVIGDPVIYPQDWLNRLTSGKSLPFNALLVGENGEDLLPDGISKARKLRDKLNSLNLILETDSPTYSWTDNSTRPMDVILNQLDPLAYTASRIAIIQYQSANKALAQSEPLSVIKVLPKVVASNSHSIHKGALITNAISGKVSVGNGSNSLESKVLENCEISYAYSIGSSTDSIVIQNGESIFLEIEGTHATKAGRKDMTYIRKSGGAATITMATSFESNPDYWIPVFTDSTPKHSTLILDSEISSGAKWIVSLAVADNNEYVVQVVGQEVVSNSGVYDGDDGEFTQLVNGILIDLNGNEIQTKVLIKRTGVFK